MKILVACIMTLFLHTAVFAQEIGKGVYGTPVKEARRILARRLGEPTDHDDHVSIRVVACGSRHTVKQAFGPADLCAEVRVQPHGDHRYLVVSWDYAEKVGSYAGMDASAPMSGGIEGETDGFDLSAEEAMNGSMGSTEEDLDGAQERIQPRVGGHQMKGLSGGTYEVVARVYDDTSHRSVSCSGRATLMVR